MGYSGERRTPAPCADIRVIVIVLAPRRRAFCAAPGRPGQTLAIIGITGITASDHRNNPKPILSHTTSPNGLPAVFWSARPAQFS
jgi:hypothetical protein